MGLETATYINQLVATNPVGASDPKSQGDDHIRLIKAVLQATFPNINAAITVTDEEINRLAGVTALVEEMRGLAYSDQASPYQIAAGDIGKVIYITSGSGSITLPNLSNNFACLIGNTRGTGMTITSSSGNLEWMNGAGTVGILTGDRLLRNPGIVCVHRYSNKWRIFGNGLS